MNDFENHSTHLLDQLVSYLTRNYPDDQWDSTTRQLIEQAREHLGWPPIVWEIEPELPN